MHQWFLILFVIWVLPNLDDVTEKFTGKGKSYYYEATCRTDQYERKDVFKCDTLTDKLLWNNEVTFTTDYNTQSVFVENYIITKLKDCKVIDHENWSCGNYSKDEMTYKMINGHLQSQVFQGPNSDWWHKNMLTTIIYWVRAFNE